MARSAVVWKARRLRRRGRHSEAIDLLKAAAAGSDDPALCVELVQARREAAAARRPTEGRPEWPPLPSSELELEGAPPEVEAADLTWQAIASGIASRGSLLVRGLLDDTQVERLRRVVTTTYEAAGAPEGAADEGWFVPFDAPGAGLPARRTWARDAGAIWLSDSPRALNEVLDVFDQLALPDLLAAYFGERPMFTLEKATLRRVTPDVTPDWHQDGAFMGPGLRSLNIWITLTACGGDALGPALDVLPMRLDDFVVTGTGGALLDDFVGRSVIAELAESCPVARPRFEPGDALIFDDHCLHCTGVDPGMVGERLGIEFWFFAPSTVPERYQPMAL